MTTSCNKKIQKELNNQIDIGRVVHYHNLEYSIEWINSKIPALDNLTPLECMENNELTLRLKVCLMRFP